MADNNLQPLDKPGKTPIDAKKAEPKKQPREKKERKRRFSGWIRELRSEGKKIVWPSAKTVVNNTLIVIVCVIVVVIIVAVADLAFRQALGWFTGLFR